MDINKIIEGNMKEIDRMIQECDKEQENKMSEADKLFEELGYKKYEHNIFVETLKREDWVTQDEAYIKYLDEKVINGTYYSMFIMFMMNNKRIQIGGYEKGTNSYGKHYEMLRNPILNLQELKAIQMKCDELGWI